MSIHMVHLYKSGRVLDWQSYYIVFNIETGDSTQSRFGEYHNDLRIYPSIRFQLVKVFLNSFPKGKYPLFVESRTNKRYRIGDSISPQVQLAYSYFSIDLAVSETEWKEFMSINDLDFRVPRVRSLCAEYIADDISYRELYQELYPYIIAHKLKH